MLLILLIQVIGDGVRAVYKSNSAPDSLIDLRTGNAEVPLRRHSWSNHRRLRWNVRRNDAADGANAASTFRAPSPRPVNTQARVIFIAVIAVGWRLLTVPFCRGFAGIEAFNAFMAVKSQYFLFETGTDNPFERADNNV